MANITFLEAVNRVLTRLRVSQVNSLSGANTYTRLIMAYVNEAKEEVEAAWNWNAENTSLELSIEAGTNLYSLTGFGDEFKIELVFDTTNNYYLQGPATAANMVAWTFLAADLAIATYAWGIYGRDASGDPQIRFYPTPNQATTINVLARVKGTYLQADSNAITVPWRPVVLGAYVKAVSERGEDGGASWDEANMAYEKALGDAIAYDANLGHTNKDWVVV